MSLAKTAGTALAALAGAALFTSIMASPAAAMPLPAPDGVADVAQPVQDVWYDRWGYWRPYHRHYRPVYYARPYYVRPYFAPPMFYGRNCWRGYYGHLHCSW